MNKKNIKSAFESMMFIWGEPLSAKEAGNVLGIDSDEALEIMRELAEEYEQEGRGIVIREVNGSFQYVTRESNADYIERLCTPVKIRRLSQSALEVLAIVAYRQPVTKGEIEAIRGIKCDRVMEGLLAKGLVEAVGRSQAIGRPVLYGTTDTFLKNFGFTSLKDLPEIEDIETAINTEDAEVTEEEKDYNQIELDIEL
ncbi:MAG: SMC-Scp complex subunit ScpB [Firmicutes bacterium]|nr:SMC-Scp complex subunit ScpB [Clostridiales bacterium]MBQ5954862.1 SMC-Scp complex subunit ScpB [Bacillota bacterium]MBR3184417.1 SMC-Scp complex subunit ScpB [Bacillota bacterium]MBR3260412.1 SMC-Scp complex subunit ScpB [Bacillota bacterium]MBR4025022.1 SMC-Scp complex subunit ScpB [Bacillota bacterium]